MKTTLFVGIVSCVVALLATQAAAADLCVPSPCTCNDGGRPGCWPGCTNDWVGLTFTCHCTSGFELSADDVTVCVPSDCDDGYVYNGWECVRDCATGYELDMYMNCADVDECEYQMSYCNCNGLSGCSATCTNTPGSYTCGCSPGFTLEDDYTCIVDPCASNPCGCDGLPGCAPSCLTSGATFTCGCSFGFEISSDDATVCVDVDECDRQTDDCKCATDLSDTDCAPICENFDGSYSCDCTDGYRTDSDAITCVIDPWY